MNEESQTKDLPEQETKESIKPGPVSIWLNKQGLDHDLIESDNLDIETIKVNSKILLEVVSALKDYGFNYLQCQGGYDEGPGLPIVCFYNLIEMKDFTKDFNPKEVRIKVFLDRNGDLRVPSLYSLFKGSDWQERETYDMFGVNFDNHPHPKRLLMPEDWKGWPLRKDYVQPDFYEMQDAY